MLKHCEKLVNNNLTKNDLLPYIKIGRTNSNDISQIISVLMKSGFNIRSEEEVMYQLFYSKADFNNSVKLYDERTNEIYGLLIFSHYTLKEGSPLPNISPSMIKLLKNYSQLNGFAFVIDTRLRGLGYDKKMLSYNKSFMDNYDFIWCAVEKELNSHNYWKRLKFHELFAIPEASFYLYFNNKNILHDIYNKCMSDIYEENYNE